MERPFRATGAAFRLFGARDRRFDHPLPGLGIAGGGGRFVRLANGVKHRKRLVQMLFPNQIDLLAG